MSVHVLELNDSSVQFSPKRSPAHETDATPITLPELINIPPAVAVALADANMLALAKYSTPPKQDAEATPDTLAELRRIRMASASTVALALIDADVLRILVAAAVVEADADIFAAPSRMRCAVAVADAFADALTDTS